MRLAGRSSAFLGLVLVLASAVQARADARPAATTAAAGRPPAANIAWFHDIYEAHKRSVETGRPMMIVFGASWCHYCREMDNTTFRSRPLADYVSANFIPVHLDKDQDKRVAQILKVEPIPCTVVLTPDAQVLTKVVGYQDVPQYRSELEKSRKRYEKLQGRRK